MPKPICFMVMPFGTKPIPEPPKNGPDKIDFDSLWERALMPALQSLGYEPVRADQDVGALIIQEMLERLFFSDLIVADLTIPNANVYYEIGIRHACKDRGCVLISADWAKPLFDINQMRRVVYPLPEEKISDATATAIQTALKTGLPDLAKGISPMSQSLPGYPSKVDPQRANSIKAALQELSAFQAGLRAVRLLPEQERRARAVQLVGEYPPASMKIASVALELLNFVRDCVGWKEIQDYIAGLPSVIRDLEVVQEQRCLAQSKLGDHFAAIAALEELIRTHGDTPERQGLIGGRYKKISAAAQDENEKRRYLDLAIQAYERGMKLDLNDYYPTSNLCRLYRARNRRGDEARAQTAASVTVIACERARQRNSGDPWLKPTLLGAAFDAADVDAAERFVEEVRTEGQAAWMLASTISDLERGCGQIKDADIQATFRGLVDDLKALLQK